MSSSAPDNAQDNTAREMSGATSKALATVTLVLLPFDVLTVILRFRARLVRRVWGSDDWAMLVSLVSPVIRLPLVV